MPRFKLFLEYEGTRYSGWQVQKNARTIQGELIGVVRKVFETDEFELYGAGRTDAGVHALGQVAHLDVKTVLAPEIIRQRMNDNLPADINILEAEKAAKNFHARHDALARVYLYQISRRRTAFGKRYVWWIKDTLYAAKMQDAASLFLGMKNFASFTADDAEEKSTSVLVRDITIREAGAVILFRITGSHFLWKQVRQIVGVLAEVGRGHLTQGDIRRFLEVQTNEPAQYTAPPSGLFLERVIYKGDPLEVPLGPVLNLPHPPGKRSHEHRADRGTTIQLRA